MRKQDIYAAPAMWRARLGVLLVLAALMSACPSVAPNPHDAGSETPDSGEQVDAGPVDGTDGGIPQDYVRPAPVTIPPAPPPPDYSAFPRDSQGRPILARGSMLQLSPRAPDPLTALSACTSMISRCFDPEERSLDACVISTPRCATAQPWQEPDCCTDACVAVYEEKRVAGVPPITAFLQTFHGPPSCAPGVDVLTGGE